MSIEKLAEEFRKTKWPEGAEEILGRCLDALEIGDINTIKSAGRPLADLPGVGYMTFNFLERIEKEAEKQQKEKDS